MDQKRTHPMVIAAAASVLLFSLLGAAALTGVMPVGNSKSADPAAPRPAAAAAPSSSKGAAARPAPRVAAAPACANCGVIEAIRAVEVKGPSTGMGAVAGGVAGGVVGNQFGSGGTKTLLTIGGAAGGAFAGDAIEKNLKKRTAWQVTVRLDDGSLRTLSQTSQPPFAVGDRVRVVGGNGIERA